MKSFDDDDNDRGFCFSISWWWYDGGWFQVKNENVGTTLKCLRTKPILLLLLLLLLLTSKMKVCLFFCRVV
jgi:hypothetical protein